MRNKTSQILFDYWNIVRDGRIAPKRIEIDPSALSKILSQTLILEVVDGNNFPFRIAGTGICEFLGSEMRGRNFMGLWSAVDRRNFRSAFDAALTNGAPVTASVASQGQAIATHNSEILLLPLHDHKGRLSRLLGSWSQDTTSTPFVTGARPVDVHHLKAITNTWPNAATTIAQPPQITETEEPPATLYSAMTMRIVRRERRQFRVLDGGLSE